MLDQSSKNATQDSDKHSVIWRMCMSSTLQASVFTGKNYSDNLHSIKNTEDLTMKQMFDISEKLTAEQSDEIFGVNTINWDDSSWKHLSLVGDAEVICLSHAKVYVFSDSILCLGKMNENPQSNTVLEQQLDWFKDSSQHRTLDTMYGDPMEFEWNIFPGFTTLQLVREVHKFMNKMGESEQFHGRIIFMSMLMTSHGELKTMKMECIANSTFVSLFAKRFPAGRWSFLGLGSETKWYSTNKERPGGKWDRVAELMMVIGESGHPVFRATSPLSRGMLKSKGGGKLSIHFCADGIRLKLFFAQSFVLMQDS